VEGEELVPISALQHYAFCPRQCGLIHLEQSFEENALTLRGRGVHQSIERVDGCVREGLRVEYGLPLFSRALGVVGKADVIEFLPDGTPVPIEFKHGRRAERLPDQIQLTAQALCLEEMVGKEVREGAIFYFSSRRRKQVEITEELRELTKETIRQTRALLMSMRLPPPVNDSRCKNCSLIDICQPSIIAQGERRQRLQDVLFHGEGP